MHRVPETIRRVLFKPHPKQAEFIKAVLSGKYSDILFGGAVAGGKTYVLCATIIMLARLYPNSRWALVRKDWPTLKKNLIPEFWKVMPQSFMYGGKRERCYNKTDGEVKCANGSVIIFWPATKPTDPDLGRWKGLNVNGIGIDEADENPREVYIKAGERSGRWKHPLLKVRPPKLVLLTCNPNRNWIKTEFYDQWAVGALDEWKLYIPSYATDNPSIEQSVRDDWERRRKADPAWYERFILGNWDLHENEGQLVSTDNINKAFKRGENINEKALDSLPGEWYLGVDVALKGKDKTVFALRKGNTLVEIESWDYNEDTSQVARLVRDKILKHGIKPAHVTVDVIGVGAGVVSELKNHYGMKVVAFNSSGKSDYSDDYYSFKNLRAEGWWKLRERFIDGDVVFAPKIKSCRALVDEICAVTYDADERVVKINKKSDIKKELSRSPDYADALMYAFVEVTDLDWLSKLTQY